MSSNYNSEILSRSRNEDFMRQFRELLERYPASNRDGYTGIYRINKDGTPSKAVAKKMINDCSEGNKNVDVTGCDQIPVCRLIIIIEVSDDNRKPGAEFVNETVHKYTTLFKLKNPEKNVYVVFATKECKPGSDSRVPGFPNAPLLMLNENDEINETEQNRKHWNEVFTYFAN